MYKSERELKWNDLFISAWCVLLWDSYKFRIVTSSFQFFLALFQHGRLFRFICQKKIFLLSCSESTIYDAQSSSSLYSWSASLEPLTMIVSLVCDHRTSLWLTQIFHIFLFVFFQCSVSSKEALYIFCFIYYLYTVHSFIYAAYNL